MADAPTQGSRNPANSGSLSGAMREILGKFLAGVDDMLPAVVIDYDRTENRATVRPLIQILKTDGTKIDRAHVASVPVLNLGGGNFVLSFPIAPGDIGWLKANDRDISLFLQDDGVDAPAKDVEPNTLRKHSFSDAVFIPDQFRKWTLEAEDADAVVLQSLDGTSRIALTSTGRVRLDSASVIEIKAPTLSIIGDVSHSGEWMTFGTITATTDVQAGLLVFTRISLFSHPHSGVTVGGGISGGPLP